MTAQARSLDELKKCLRIEQIWKRKDGTLTSLGWTAGGHVFGDDMVCKCGTTYHDHQKDDQRKRCVLAVRKVRAMQARERRAAKRKTKT